MGGGADTQNVRDVADKQGVLSDYQAGVGKEYMGYAAEDRGRRDEAFKPLFQLASNLTTGSSPDIVRAMAPQFKNLAAGYGRARSGIMMNPARGAASDFALSQLDVQQADAAAGLAGEGWKQGISLSQNLGSQYGNFALQEAGAGLRSTEGAGTTQAQRAQTVSQAERMAQQKKQDRMKLIGQIAGGVGAIFGGPIGAAIGGIFGKKDTGATRDAGYGVGNVMTTAPVPWTPQIVPPPTFDPTFGGSEVLT